MAVFRTIFKDANALHPISFDNARSFQWTDTRNKEGKSNFALDLSPTSRRIKAGWQVEIYRDGNRVYWGKIVDRSVKKDQIKIFAIDANGILNTRDTYQRAVVEQEASLEVIEKLDGLELAVGVKLNAQKFVEKTATAQKWHWEGNSTLAYIVDIGEQVRTMGQKPTPYFIWIDSEFNVHWRSDGRENFYTNLNIKNITLQESIRNTFNQITVRGNPVNVIPYDFDFWTENATIESWYTDSSFPSAISYDETIRIMGNISVKIVSNASSSTCYLGRYFTQNLNSYYSLENRENFVFDIYKDSATSLSDISLTFHDDDGDTVTYDWSTNPNYDSQPVTGVGRTVNFNIAGTPDSSTGGTFDWDKVQRFTLLVDFTSGTSHIIHIDRLYVKMDIYQYTAEDLPSKREFGPLPKTFIERTYYTNAETQELAELLLEYYKGSKETYNGSIDGYAELKPNSIIEFEYEGAMRRKPLASVTHYVTVNGSESCQLTFGDFKKEPIDKLIEKLSEINRNFNLLETPYRIA